MPEINITISIEGSNYNLQGIPTEAFKVFQRNAKQHFPDAGDDAWASVLTEVILALTTHEAYFMTDIIKENSIALEDVLGRVGWGFSELHAYLLHAALKPGALRIVSFHEKEKNKTQLGTFIITGLRKETLDKLESKLGASAESFMGFMFEGFENGEITVTPETAFKDMEASRS